MEVPLRGGGLLKSLPFKKKIFVLGGVFLSRLPLALKRLGLLPNEKSWGGGGLLGPVWGCLTKREARRFF